MPARCGTCGEEALTAPARFCVGCGARLREPDIDAIGADPGEEVGREREPEPAPDSAPLHPAHPLDTQSPSPAPPQDDTPQFDPKPVPARAAAAGPAPPEEPRPLAFPRPQDTSPIVPVPLVVAGVIGLLALLLILLLAA